jgi:hypothetical protein
MIQYHQLRRNMKKTKPLKLGTRHPEVLAVLHGEPRRMGHKRPWPSFETPRKRAAPQDDGGMKQKGLRSQPEPSV